MWFAPDVTFLSKEHLKRLLERDEDGYHSRFSENDLQIRQVNSVDEYLRVVENCVCEGSFDLKKKIKRCVAQIETKLVEYEYEWGVDITVLMDLPWKIGFICGKQYENGFPHTRLDTIILNVKDYNRDETALCRLLLHEKVHVYQKKFPVQMQAYLLKKGYVRTVREKAPANPDLDAYTYQSFGAKYSDHPTSFRDIQYLNNDSKFEHPYELMAYEMEKLI